MRKKIKKAFTLVELLVVIAILAILATVSIVGYNSFTKKAKESNDIVLVKQMNDILTASQQTDGNNSTMTEALEDVLGAGYDIEKLTPTTNEYDIAWDSKNDQMILMDNDRRIYPEKMKVESKEVDVFKVIDSNEALSTKYSNYLKNDYKDTTITTPTGIDVGNNTNITSVKYSRSADAKEQTVILRTNSYSTDIEVDAINDTVKHYDLGGNVNIINVKGKSYHEFGKVKSVKILNGRFVAEEGSEIENEVEKVAGGNAQVDDSKSTIWSTPEYKWSSDYSTCTASRKDKNGIKQDEVETVNSTVETIDSTVNTEGRKTYTATFTNQAFTEQKHEESIAKKLTDEERLVDEINKSLDGYTGESITKALVYLSNKGLDVKVSNLVHSDSTKTFAYDITNHEFYIVSTSTGNVEYPIEVTNHGELVYVVNNCNNITTNMTKIYINDYETISRSVFVEDSTVATSKQSFKANFEIVEIGNGVKHIVTDKSIIIDEKVYKSTKQITKYINGKLYTLYFNGEKYYWYSRTQTIKTYDFDEETDSSYLIDPCQDCFYGCTTLRKVYIGNSVQDIGLASFANCANIEYIYYNTNANFEMFNANDYSIFKTSGTSVAKGITLEIGKETLSLPNLFGTPNELNLTKVIFETESKCSTINEMAFWNSKIEEIYLPISLTTIKGTGSSAAFYGCKKLKSIKWYGNPITCGGKTYSSKNQDTSNYGISAFQEYMRNGGTHSSATNLVIELISK